MAAEDEVHHHSDAAPAMNDLLSRLRPPQQ